MAEISHNKTIAKNTLLLYGRMLITIIVGLYTSRVVLQNLGFNDYGIYNLVGSIVTMLTFLNVGMAGASQRYISYALGRGDLKSLKNVFCTSVLTHNTIAILAILLFESIGLWVVNFKLVIDPDRIFAANWVFQCSILTFALSVISVPYSACVVAHERMGQFAYISVLETVLKLLVALCIMFSSWDKLILYATLLMFIQVLVRIIYVVYCKHSFMECTYKFKFDKALYKEMFAFAGWGCVGNMGFSLKDQCSNIILNLFFGTVVNAARGVAIQVNSIINSFAMNFTMAMNPQITKQYAAGNIERSQSLAYAGSKYAFFLLSMICIPFLINEHYVLRLWLGDVPPYTDIFVYITLIASCVYAFTHTISTAIIATGHVKWFQSILAIILLLDVPLAYIILLFGGEPYWALMPSIMTNSLSLLFRIYLIKHYISSYSIKKYIVNIVLRSSIVVILAFGVSYYVGSLYDENFINVLLTSGISVMILMFFIYVLGLEQNERKMIYDKMIKKIIKR